MNKETKQIENKVKQIQEKINSRKQQLITYESTLLALIEEINELKTNMKKINKNSLKGLNNNN